MDSLKKHLKNIKTSNDKDTTSTHHWLKVILAVIVGYYFLNWLFGQGNSNKVYFFPVSASGRQKIVGGAALLDTSKESNWQLWLLLAIVIGYFVYRKKN
jgi:hypothetical protein